MHSLTGQNLQTKCQQQDNFWTIAWCAQKQWPVTALSPFTLCPGFQLPVPLLAPIPEVTSFLGGPGGCGETCLRKALSQSLPAPASSSQAFTGNPGTGLKVRSQRWTLGKQLPVPSHSLPQIQSRAEIQGDDPNGKQLPPSSQRTSQRGRVGKGSETRRPRCYSGFIIFPPQYFYPVSVSLPPPIRGIWTVICIPFKWNSAGKHNRFD